MPDIIRDIIVVALAIIGLIILWEVLQLLLVVLVISVIIVFGYRIALWLYNLVSSNRHKL